MKKLANKIAIVTGGTRGIGAAITRKLAAEGATVVFTYHNSVAKAQELAAEIKNKGGLAIPLVADSANKADLQKVIAYAAQEYGRVDILVNNAGIYIGKPFEDYTLQDYESTMDIHVRAVFMGSQEAVKYMPQGGRIISIGSNMAENAIGPQTTLYTMSKSALQGFTRGLARDLGPRKITVNLVQPGPTNTDMNPDGTERAELRKARIAIGEYGSPEDIANTVAFLAGEESRFITGSFITVDGGLNA
ncbi:SDR family NAD(P)-dependent oxidoreductase [Mucilaginibacter endophyticus]|uniref:SDR family NAD(P)-dependent oxidoreductase n=1 Tax=Mucilaginibacter endophyticus TaxID=2675003 RepID=UPI000E0D9A99|nr:3-oxoacyl-ACP reductase family protein [Mucilaginibacter endophyticus]